MSAAPHPVAPIHAVATPMRMRLSVTGWRWPGVFPWLLAAAILARFVAMIFTPLLPEEAYYWMYAQHPSLSYFDHPPMVAWVIGAGTAIFGDSQFGVRIAGNLLMVLASFVMYRFARIWFDRTTSVLSAASLHVLPAYFATGFIATMDAPLLFFWLVCLLGLSIALKLDRPWGWQLAAVGLGGAMLSKYTGVFLGAGALAAMLGHRNWRGQLRSPYPYIAALVSLALFSPVLIWNWQHDWASLRFQAEGRFHDRGMSLGSFATFPAVQLAVLLPILLAAAVWLLMRLIRQPRRFRSARTWFTQCLCAPLLAVMAWKSMKYSIHINWTLPAFLSLMPAIIHLLRIAVRTERRHVHGWKWENPVRWMIWACLLFDVLAPIYLVTLLPMVRLPREFGPWREVATIVEEIEDRLEAEQGRVPIVIANGEYRLASVLAFYRPPDEPAWESTQLTTSQWFLRGEGLGYEYWTNPAGFIGTDCVYIDDKGDLLNHVNKRFDSVEVIDDPRLKALGDYQLAICRGYRGPAPPPKPVRPESK